MLLEQTTTCSGPEIERFPSTDSRVAATGSRRRLDPPLPGVAIRAPSARSPANRALGHG